MTLTAADLAFALHKAPHTIECAITNLHALVDRPRPYFNTVQAGASLVVGAGPSLDLERVRSTRESGWAIWTVNTAARGVCSVVAPHVLVVRESLDVSEHLDGLRHPPDMIVADLCAHPRVFSRADAWFVPATVQTFDLAARLGVVPVYGGTATLTSAVAMAARGAECVALEGVDLAYRRDDGKGYSDASRFAGADLVGARFDEARGMILGDVSNTEQRALAERSGHHPPPSLNTLLPVEADDDGPHLLALGTWVDQIEWLERYAERNPEAGLVRGVGAAKLRGWRQLIGDFDPGHVEAIKVVRVEVDRVRDALADVARQAASSLAICDAVQSGADPTLLPGFVDGCPLPETHAVGRTVLAMREGPDPNKRVRDVYDVMRESAAKVAEKVGTA